MRYSGMLMIVPFLLLAQQGGMQGPKYTDNGRLVRPEGYREWQFAGSNLGMGYTEGPTPPKAMYHNIYIQREAFAEFKKSGKFPDKTMLVMEVLSQGTNESINRKGSFADRLIGVEVALKDEGRFPEKWAYFNFIGEGGKALADAGAMHKEQCWKCHNDHGAADNVFVQFYPNLREHLKKEK